MTNKEMTSEQTSETPVEDASVDIAVEETVVEETPEVETTTNGTTDKSINYLDPQLFRDIRTISRQEIEEAEINEDVADKLKNKYENSLAEISENQVIKGRVIGMNDHVILIDIGFKSEGMIDREEFNEETLPRSVIRLIYIWNGLKTAAVIWFFPRKRLISCAAGKS